MLKTKILVFYLPQYHEIEENNKWWGKGFTEWVNVKSGKPLFKNHYQPKVPYKENYYDLSKASALIEQAKLAENYGVDGFCFYHYWFKGKKLLEKPAEILLENPEIKMPYCFSWANETWSRRWNGSENEVLIKQEYGDKTDWEEHFQYLLPFFKDSRYICFEDKPILLLYRAFDIEKCDEMISYWNERIVEEGFKGIYIIETLGGFQKNGCISNSSAYVEFEPLYTLRSNVNFFNRLYRYIFIHCKLSKIGFIDCASYDAIWKKILSRKRQDNKKTYLGAFPGWDNTARRKRNGLVVKGSDPQKFEKYFLQQYRNSMMMDNEFIFINAWNEWGEGAYLEPDNKYEFQMLQAIKNVKEK